MIAKVLGVRMPKYRVEWWFGSAKPKAIGTLIYADDEAAIEKIVPLCKEDGWGAIISRPDRKLIVARIEPDGSIERLGTKMATGRARGSSPSLTLPSRTPAR